MAWIGKDCQLMKSRVLYMFAQKGNLTNESLAGLGVPVWSCDPFSVGCRR
jgi:hypothetical protein